MMTLQEENAYLVQKGQIELKQNTQVSYILETFWPNISVSSPRVWW